ncbi:MAG: hemolysin family protein [Dermatophilaceae bacterium]
MDVLPDALLVVVFVLFGGVFAAAEIALVSLREGQVARLERRGRRGRRVAELARDSTVFLSAVQIGVTFAGFFSSAFGAATIAPALTPLLVRFGLPQSAAATGALVLLTLGISYLSLVLGELVPKRVAILRAEPVALALGPPLSRFAWLVRPIIWLLGVSSNVVLRLLRVDPDDDAERITDEEVRELVTTHEGFTPAERALLSDVIGSSRRLVVEVMRPRSDVVGIRESSTVGEAAGLVRDKPYSRYPVYRGSLDDITGFVHVRDVLQALHEYGPDARVASVRRDILALPATLRLPAAMQRMREEGHHVAVVVDEYGGTDGVVTLEDLLEELVGEIWDEYDADEQGHELRLHESRMLDGSTNLEEFADRTGVRLDDGPYETVAGWMLARLGRLAIVGDVVRVEPLDSDESDRSGSGRAVLVEVTEVASRRITAVRVSRPSADDTPPVDEPPVV